MRKSKIICIDIETTGLDKAKDEILQVAIINGKGRTLYNSYIRPDRARTWKAAEAINKISFEMVEHAPTIGHEKRKLDKIFKQADLIVGYNLKMFDLPFLAAKGIKTDVKAQIYDVMLKFAPIAAEYDEVHNCYRWKPLTYCAGWYGYANYNPHDALEDVRAALHCYYAMQKEEKQNRRRAKQKVKHLKRYLLKSRWNSCKDWIKRSLRGSRKEG